MTGNDLYLKTRTVLGAENVGIDRNDDALLKKEAAKMIAIILQDLGIDTEFSSMADEISCNANEEQALIYGLAMYICVALGLQNRQSFFAGLYASHRTRAKGKAERVIDVMPRGEPV
ncbi:MAG: hypothetical protein KBS52_03785 [Clostridiales bacterium]|nr:hypothetical protein [Candidatus Equinaster intestinalis]